MNQDDLLEYLGGIDPHLLEQVRKNNLQPGMKVLETGMGHGSNIDYFIRAGYEVWGIDHNPDYIDFVKKKIAQPFPNYPLERFACCAVEEMPFEVPTFDAIFSIRVLHFAKNLDHFHQMMEAMWKALKPSGLLFIRTASSWGISTTLQSIRDGRFRLNDGLELFLVPEEILETWMSQKLAIGAEPLRITYESPGRSLATWVILKQSSIL